MTRERPRITAAKRDLRLWMDRDSFVERLIRLLSEAFPHQRILLVGGALRDHLLGKPPKDFDIIVDVPSREAVAASGLPELHDNYFGGLVFFFETRPIDIWPLRETFHIRRFEQPPTIENLLAGAPFNLDKLAYDVRYRTVHDDGCLRGVVRREIVYAPAQPYLEHVQAARCVLLRRKTSFTLHETARRLLSRASGQLRANEVLVREVHDFLWKADALDEAARCEVVDEIYQFAQPGRDELPSLYSPELST